MPYKVTVTERDELGNVETIVRSRLGYRSLATAVRILNECGWVAGAKSGTGLTITEVRIESTP